RLLLVLGGGGDAQRPGVEPAAVVALGDRGGGVAVAAGDGGGLLVLDGADHGGGVVEHGRPALGVAVQAVAEAAVGGAGLAVLADQVDVELGGAAELRGVQLGVPALVVPAAAEGVEHGVERA